MHTQLRNSKPETVKHLLHDYTVERDEVNSIFLKLRTYLDFARGYDSDFEKRDIPRWIRYKDIKPGYPLRIVGMCSVQVCDLEDRFGDDDLGGQAIHLPRNSSLFIDLRVLGS